MLQGALAHAAAEAVVGPQQPQTVVLQPAADFGQQLGEWQKTVDDIEARINAGPMETAEIATTKERLKDLRSLITNASKGAEAALKSQNDLLGTLGPAPDKATGIKEDKEVQKKRADIAAEISKVDAQIKQAALLVARTDNITASFDKQRVEIRRIELMQKSGLLLTPEVMQTALVEGRAWYAAYRPNLKGGGYILLSLIVFWYAYRSGRRLKDWFGTRESLVARARGSSLYLHMTAAALCLLADKFDVFGLNANAPVLADVMRLVCASWMLLGLFIFLLGLRFKDPEPGKEDDDGNLPIGLLNFLIAALRITVFALFAAGIAGYVQVAAYGSLNIFATFVAVALFVALRSGLVTVNARFARWQGKEETLSPLAIAIFEPTFALVSFLFAASFWGLTPGDVRDWADRFNGGVTIGSMRFDFSDAGSAALLFFVLYVATRLFQTFLAKRLFPQTRLERGVKDAVHTLIGYTGVIIATLAALGTLGLDMQKLAIVAGALSVGIGFGLQAVINNFVSGLILLFERPVRVGDLIEVGGQQGLVKKIRVRSTEMETAQFASIVVPNSKLITETVVNWTLGGRSVRVEVVVGVAYGSDTALVKKLLLDVAAEHPQVRKRPDPQVLFNNFGATALEFELRCFVRDITDKNVVASDLRFAIDKALRDNKIERTGGLAAAAAK
jgi:small-conductance mechanosensitive channel